MLNFVSKIIKNNKFKNLKKKEKKTTTKKEKKIQKKKAVGNSVNFPLFDFRIFNNKKLKYSEQHVPFCFNFSILIKF